MTDTLSTIYPFRLAWSEFRLACLTACTDGDSPVHLMLETYTDDSYPEYEAVSYTWGGEEDDTRPRRAVFIGPYWDVLPQTENCWQMLRFLRPSRGIRLVWVDAICINQRSTEERGDQVSKMERIYKRCMRTVLYLGPDAAPVLWDGRFPRRRDFHDIDVQTLQGMLARRYFRRTWVIQELVLSPHVVVRLGDTDYHIWAASMDRFKTATQWELESTSAPWFEHLTQQELRVHDPCDALQLTSHSRCSDPRDRLFGILSLLSKKDEFGGMSLRADYSISNQHMWIGFFAYCLLKCGATWFLYRAAGSTAAGIVPSWIPNWNSTTSWESFRLPVDWETSSYHVNYPSKHRRMFKSPTTQPDLAIVRCPPGLGGDWDEDLEPAFPTQFKSATVCPGSGALLGVRIQRLFTIPSVPTRVADADTTGRRADMKDDTYQLFVFNEATSLFFASDKPLDELIRPGKDHLFLLYPPSHPAALILREIDSTATDDALPDYSTFYTRSRPISVPNGRKFRMVAASPFIYFIGNQPENTFDNMSGFEIKISSFRSMSIFVDNRVASMTQRTMYCLVEECHAELLNSSGLPCFEAQCGGQCLFLNSRPPRDFTGNKLLIWLVVSLFWVIVQDLLRERDLEESYISCLDPRFLPYINGPYIHVSVEPAHWSVFGIAFDQHMDDHDLSLSLWEWRLGDGDWRPLWELPGPNRDVPEIARAMSFRADIKSLIQGLRRTESIFISALLALRRLSVLSADSSPQEVRNALHQPKEEYRSILLEGGLGPFSADGRYYDIDIL